MMQIQTDNSKNFGGKKVWIIWNIFRFVLKKKNQSLVHKCLLGIEKILRHLVALYRFKNTQDNKLYEL